MDPRFVLMLAAGTLLLLNGLIARGVEPPQGDDAAPTPANAEERESREI